MFDFVLDLIRNSFKMFKLPYTIPLMFHGKTFGGFKQGVQYILGIEVVMYTNNLLHVKVCLLFSLKCDEPSRCSEVNRRTSDEEHELYLYGDEVHR